jgi:hypothetical protein
MGMFPYTMAKELQTPTKRIDLRTVTAIKDRIIMEMVTGPDSTLDREMREIIRTVTMEDAELTRPEPAITRGSDRSILTTASPMGTSKIRTITTIIIATPIPTKIDVGMEMDISEMEVSRTRIIEFPWETTTTNIVEHVASTTITVRTFAGSYEMIPAGRSGKVCQVRTATTVSRNLT